MHLRVLTYFEIPYANRDLKNLITKTILRQEGIIVCGDKIWEK